MTRGSCEHFPNAEKRGHQKVDWIDFQFLNKSKFTPFFVSEYAISFDSIVQHKAFVFVVDVRIVFVSQTHVQPSRGRQFIVPILIEYALPTLVVSLWCQRKINAFSYSGGAGCGSFGWLIVCGCVRHLLYVEWREQGRCRFWLIPLCQFFLLLINVHIHR